MPGSSNVRYQSCSGIDWLTDVLALHEHKKAHQFDKESTNLEDRDRRNIFCVT